MGHGHASPVSSFIKTDEDTLVGQLVKGVTATGIASHRSSQIEAWKSEIRLLKEQLADSRFQDWYIILEYEIPRRSRRPDVILLTPSTILVVEFKIGAQIYDSLSCWQANSYARDLKDFHAESHQRRIVPVLCATDADQISLGGLHPHDSETDVASLVKTNGANLGFCLKNVACADEATGTEPIAPESWLNSAYRPTPTILEAAKRLYQGHNVRELSHRFAQNLDQTTEMLLREIDEARRYRRRVICFVTGVPGAGKTLTGLNVVHSPSIRQWSSLSGIFLSGNQFLVKVVLEALVQSQVSKGSKRTVAQHKASTFILNVHKFLRHHLDKPTERPHENVVVFDEAQRAWDRSQMMRKQRVDASEAALLLGVMERLPDWAVVVALVGGGQEIFLGEAGLSEWGRALENRPVPWHVVASPEVLTGGHSVAGHRLFEGGGVPDNISYRQDPLAHLDVVVRSHRAQRWAEWVNEFLSLRFDIARTLFPDTSDFPCFVTRDLEQARSWLRVHHSLDTEERIGLIATSKDHRLRAHGIERSTSFLMNYAFQHWFLGLDTDVRSSFALEVAASEFECQGLELDWVGLCWGGDLTPSEDYLSWSYRKFRGARWQAVRQEAERLYTLNRYRVLLTRARRGLVIWVPKGDPSDPTREPDRFERVFDALRRAGVPSLEDDFFQP